MTTNTTPTLDPAFVIGWHVGKAASDREHAAEQAVARRVPEYLRALSVADGRIAA